MCLIQVGHVHNQRCEDNQSGGHWQVDSNGLADESNELWVRGVLSATQTSFSDTRYFTLNTTITILKN